MTPWETFARPPRPWQATALPIALDACKTGQRGAVSAVMGSGKSILIAELCRELLDGLPTDFVLIVTTPTIRLVEQLDETLSPHVDTGRFYTHAHELDHRVIISCIPSTQSLAEALREKGKRCAVWLADEAHRTEAARIVAASEQLQPFSSIGFSATPFLSDPKRRLRHFDQLIFSYSAQDAIRDGVIVPPVLVHYTGDGADVDSAVLEMVRAQSGPGIINAADIADASRYASTLSESGFPAAAIHSELSRAEQARLLAALAAGELRALVHVKLLSEGVDLPWLQWLCLRSPVSSRVTFCQMVGRVLRAHPGKESAAILDPHDQFNGFSLSYDAMLGCEPQALGDTLEELADDILRERKEALEAAPLPVFYNRLSSYLRRLVLALYAVGLSERKIKGTRWRRDIASDKQLEAVQRALWALRYAPEPHHSLLSEAIEATGGGFFSQLTKGDVSDLLEILFTLGRIRQWPRLETLQEDM